MLHYHCLLESHILLNFEGQTLVHNLVPHKSRAGEYSGLGHDAELDYHSENAALKHTPEYNSPTGLILQGVRHDAAAPVTMISDAIKLLNACQKKILQSLKRGSLV